MALKPIGSEKLIGDDKIKRIMEIARYGEVEKNTEYHTQTVSFSKKATDGNVYAIVNEKDGYYIKRGINESQLDYIDGLNNKKKNRFRSYSSALKRLNLVFKPLNEEFNEGKSDPIFEQSSKENKFVLKTPEAEGAVEPVVDVDSEEEIIDEPMDMGDEELEMDDEELDMGDEELEMDDEEGEEEEMEGFMKPIQKLTGKLGQKLRDAEEELGSADIKYVINSVLSAVDLDSLDGEDRDDILARFEEDETAYGDEELGGEELDMGDEELDIDDDMEGLEDEGEGEEFDMETMMPESTGKRKNIISEQFLMGPLLPLLPFVKPELAKILKKAKDEKAIQKFTAAQIAMVEAALIAFPSGAIFKALKYIIKIATKAASKGAQGTKKVLQPIKEQTLILEQGGAFAKLIKAFLRIWKGKAMKGGTLTTAELATLTMLVSISPGLLLPLGVTAKMLKDMKGAIAAKGVVKGLGKAIDKEVKKTQKKLDEGVNESLKNRVSKLLESYVTKQTPKEYIKERVSINKLNGTIKKMSRTVEQELSIKKYLSENKYSKIKGLTKEGKIVIASGRQNIVVNKDGSIR